MVTVSITIKKTGAVTRSLNYDSATYDEISPKISLNYQADEDTNYYVSYGHSFNHHHYIKYTVMVVVIWAVL